MEVGAQEGHEFDFSAMFDRVDHPALGRVGGGPGAPTTISRSDGSEMRGKGRQFVPHGQKVMLAFPGGAGYGEASTRNRAHVTRDLVRGYISAQSAKDDYGLTDEEIADALEKARLGAEA